VSVRLQLLPLGEGGEAETLFRLDGWGSTKAFPREGGTINRPRVIVPDGDKRGGSEQSERGGQAA